MYGMMVSQSIKYIKEGGRTCLTNLLNKDFEEIDQAFQDKYDDPFTIFGVSSYDDACAATHPYHRGFGGLGGGFGFGGFRCAANQQQSG